MKRFLRFRVSSHSLPIEVGSSHEVWWSCDQCPEGLPHVWEATVDSRTSGTGCPFAQATACTSTTHLLDRHHKLVRFGMTPKLSLDPKSIDFSQWKESPLEMRSLFE